MDEHRLTVGILRKPLALDTTLDLRAVLPPAIGLVAAVLEVDACRLVYAAAIRVVVPAAVRAVAVCTTRMLDLAFNDIGARFAGIATAEHDRRDHAAQQRYFANRDHGREDIVRGDS